MKLELMEGTNIGSLAEFTLDIKDVKGLIRRRFHYNLRRSYELHKLSAH